jgi:4-amino-4-deoxy-L-arabinose transferase-like glycosyltransferase
LKTQRADLRARGHAIFRRHWWWFACGGIILLGVVVRVWLLVRANWMLDGDEATMGLVGRNIQTRGERPIFFPGQAYMGAWQAYLSAIAFSLFGMSREAAKLVPLLSSATFIGTTMLLARRIYTPKVALVAGLFAALPSLYLLSTTLRLSYPLIDVMALGNVILLLAIDTTYRPQAPQHFARRCLALGLLAGFGFWLHSAIAMYLIPAGLLLLLRWPRRALLIAAPVGALGFVVGAAPVFHFAWQYDYTTFHYLLGSDADTAGRDYPAIAQHLVRHLFPRYLGASVPWQDAHPLLQVMIGLPTVGSIAYLVGRAWRTPLQWLRLRPHCTHPEVVMVLFAGVVVTTYVLSRFSVYAITFANVDATGRYLAPLGSFLPVALAGATWHLARRSRAGQIVAIALAASVLSGTLANYARTDAPQVFQSPYYRHLPAQSAGLIVALDELGVREVWMDHWAGKPLMFDSQGRIVAADWYDLRIGMAIDRHSEASDRVFAAANPAFVFVTTEPRIPLEETLEARGISYTARRVDGYVVILPAERIDPATVVEDLRTGR